MKILRIFFFGKFLDLVYHPLINILHPFINPEQPSFSLTFKNFSLNNHQNIIGPPQKSKITQRISSHAHERNRYTSMVVPFGFPMSWEKNFLLRGKLISNFTFNSVVINLIESPLKLIENLLSLSSACEGGKFHRISPCHAGW